MLIRALETFLELGHMPQMSGALLPVIVNATLGGSVPSQEDMALMAAALAHGFRIGTNIGAAAPPSDRSHT